MNIEAVKKELLRRKAAFNMWDYAHYLRPEFDWSWHHRLLCEHLDLLVEGKILRLMVFMPPRHGKSELVSKLFPGYWFGHFPDHEIKLATYAKDLAIEMNRGLQSTLDSEEYQAVFSNIKIPIGNVRTGVTRIRNADGFDLVDQNGSYRSAGVGGPITGKGAHLGIIDDVVKDKADALSPSSRQKVYDWFMSTFLTRAAPNYRLLLTFTRWHEDDLAGRLLKLAKESEFADQYVVLSLPAVATERNMHPKDPRKPGEALWPTRYPLEELRKFMVDPTVWSALYQQNPMSGESTYFQKFNWPILDSNPGQLWASARFWDFAATKKGKYTCGVRMHRFSKGKLIDDEVRFRGGPDEVMNIFIETVKRDGPSIRQRWELEKGSAGLLWAGALKKAIENLPGGYQGEPVATSGDKEVRAAPYSAQQSKREIYLLKAPWNEFFIEEHYAFPHGAFSDRIDAGSGAWGICENLASGGSSAIFDFSYPHYEL